MNHSVRSPSHRRIYLGVKQLISHCWHFMHELPSCHQISSGRSLHDMAKPWESWSRALAVRAVSPMLLAWMLQALQLGQGKEGGTEQAGNLSTFSAINAWGNQIYCLKVAAASYFISGCCFLPRRSIFCLPINCLLCLFSLDRKKRNQLHLLLVGNGNQQNKLTANKVQFLRTYV